MSSVMDKHNVSYIRRWLNWFLPAFFYFYQSGIQVLPSINQDYLINHFILNELEFAFVSMSFLTPYVIMQIPNGIIFDHFNSRKVLSFALFLFAIGFFLLSIADIWQLYYLYLTGMFFQGISASCACLSAIYMANIWLNENEYKLAVSFTAIMSILGFFFISMLFDWLSEYFKYANVLLVNGMISILFMLIVIYFLNDPVKKEHLSLNVIWGNFKKAAQSKVILMIALYNGCLYTNIALLANLWRIDYLQHHFFLTKMQAIIDNGYTLFGYIVGSLFYGLIAQRIKELAGIMTVSAFALFMIFFTCHFLVSDVHLKVYFYFVMGFLTSSLVLSFTILKQRVDPIIIGLSLGMVLTSQKLIGMLLIPLIAFLFQVTNENYVLATIPVVFTAFIAIICSSYVLYHKK